MTSDVNISRRPGLEPIWTPSYHYVSDMPKTIVRPTPISAGLSPSPISPKAFPSLPSPNPVHPASYDGSMRRQDRALVNSLDQRAVPSLNSALLTPVEEYSPSPLVARLEKISILPPMSIANNPLAPAPPEAPLRRRSLMSLDGPASMRAQHQVRNHSYSSMEYLTSPNSPRWDATMRLRNQLRNWGHVYLGNSKMADAFIIARSLRQHNCHSPTSPPFAKLPPLPPPTAAAAGGGAPPNKRLTVRAIIRPQSQDRPAFLIQRNFDIEELRATIPDPPPAHAPAMKGVSDGPRSPAGFMSRKNGVPASTAPPPSLLLLSLSSSQSRPRRSSVAGRSDASALDLESLIRDGKAIPMHLPYARAYLPVVAALLVSGHICEGDVVYLPMPHAEAWPATVRYVYTGQGELTEAVRENILYLAGKV
ncbi:uncharacterized protein F4812DRAFT_443279 [Daldinia caldariorum]|uniref:uncharacterized protein n=1 Tax=Daldinia caldariorum TaxID=326644 RepID=UPI002008E135|nr:uncharacterized protein F4812DRAFT_443279 [Daldinia caldariorum]KAI1464398.1 hypothetical protein F4812DRAFT_443279 [Daldinia caldariorum]